MGLALMGAQVDSIEIDPLAIDNARENARMNGVDDRIRLDQDLSEALGPFDLVVANILRPVLLEFAEELVGRLDQRPGATLILSGLIERDVAEVTRRYSALLSCEPMAGERGEWRRLVWRRPS